jgi:hypothetical protein
MTRCMVRPCVARGFRRTGGYAVLHQCIRPLIGRVDEQRARDFEANLHATALKCADSICVQRNVADTWFHEGGPPLALDDAMRFPVGAAARNHALEEEARGRLSIEKAGRFRRNLHEHGRASVSCVRTAFS